LASAYGIVKAHGGFIDVESRIGKGSTFIVFLAASSKKIPKPVRYGEHIMKGAETILLVDDEEAIRKVGQEMLQAMGYRVLTACDGKEAISMYEQNNGDINMVILDMVMPHMGGAETYDALKRMDADVKVLLLSGYSVDGQAREILKRGCDGFIQKPFDMKDLSGKVRQILDKPSQKEPSSVGGKH
jgi:CheY-like chemotaxis protein